MEQFPAQKLGFFMIWKHKDSFCSLNDSLKSLKFVSGFSPRHIFVFSLIILLLWILYGALGRDENFEAHLPCICCKVKFWTSPEGSVILLDQSYASVWNLVEIYSLVWFDLYLFWDMASLYFFMSLHVLIHFFQCFWDLHVSHFFQFFLHSLFVSF